MLLSSLNQLILLFGLILVAIIGCRQESTSTPVSPPQIKQKTSTRLPEQSGETPTITPTEEIQATPYEEPEKSEPDINEPTAVSTVASENPGIPCGVLLPLIPEETELVHSLPNTSAPDDLVPAGALPALERILSAPSTVGLAAFQIGREEEGVYLNADAPMPLASVVKIVNLVAYANAVAEGELDPTEWIPLEEIERFYLRGMDLGAHRRALQELDERGLVGLEPPSTPLEEVPWMMIRHSSNAAADYLHLAVGQERVERTAQELGLSSQTAPCPWLGQFLVMSNYDRPDSDFTAVSDMIDNPDAYAQEVMRLTEAFANDPASRNIRPGAGFSRPPIAVQKLFAENLNAQASAADYARLMAMIMQNGLSTPYTNILVRRVLEWPTAFPANQELFTIVGYKNGSLAGILTTAYYAQRLEDGAQVVVILFFRDLPMQTYRRWRQTLPQDELARWLLTEPDAIPSMQALLTEEIQ